jgi:hypothetical protein
MNTAIPYTYEKIIAVRTTAAFEAEEFKKKWNEAAVFVF